MNTHKVIGENIIKYGSSKNISLISTKRFIWGNVKPDCVIKYKLMKHYYDESIDIILKKIFYLSSLTLEDVYYSMTIEKFSEELGVICHFLCDYFCAPHYYRWECKTTSAARKHMSYEKRLARIAKKFRPAVIINQEITLGNLKEFINDMQRSYEGRVSPEDDLAFSYHVCSAVVEMILNNVISNSRGNKVI